MTRPDRRPAPRKRPPQRTPLDPARRAAFDVLRAVSERDAYANLALPALLTERGIEGRDAAFATELTYGACRARGLLDAVIAKAAGRPTERIDPVLLDLLRLGAYQLLRTRVEPHAAVSTTVDQAGIEFDTPRAGFVNGVMRTIAARDEQAWTDELAPAAASDPVGHSAFVHAHPRWIAQAFTDALGARAGELGAARSRRRCGTWRPSSARSGSSSPPRTTSTRTPRTRTTCRAPSRASWSSSSGPPGSTTSPRTRSSSRSGSPRSTRGGTRSRSGSARRVTSWHG